MGQVKKIIYRITRPVLQWALQVDMDKAVDSEMTRPGTLSPDGVPYTLPPYLPGWIRREAKTDDKLAKAMGLQLQEAAADYVSQFGDPYAENPPVSVAVEDPLTEAGQGAREAWLTSCHAAFQRNPYANAIVQYTTQFVVGDGVNLSYQNKDVADVVNAFMNNPENDMAQYQRDMVNDLQVDGELIVRLFPADDGTLVIAPQRPWDLVDILHESGFMKRILKYVFQYSDGGKKEVAADEVIFVAINKHGYELRGRSELYRLLPWLRAYVEWLSDRARQSKWRGAVLWLVRVLGGASAVAKVKSDWSRPPTPGSNYVTTQNVEVTPLSNSNAPGAAEGQSDGRQFLLAILSGSRMPEYMFGDGSNANLATATRQELPVLTKFEHFQSIIIAEFWKPLIRAVLTEAVERNVLPATVPVQDIDGNPIPDREPVGTLEAFAAAYEPVTSQNILTQTQALHLQKQNGWVDNTSAMENLGYDPQVIMKRIANDRDKEQTDVARGLIPKPPSDDIPPRATPTGQDGDNTEPGGDAAGDETE